MRSRGLLLSTLAVLALAADVAPQATPPKPAPPRAPAAKPTPAPPPVLEGVVRGPDRKPIEKALVAAAPTAPPAGSRMFERPPAVSTRTDAAGRFRLTLRKNEPQTVRVEALGLAAATRKDVAPGTPLTFDLTAGGAIEGTVRDGDSGQPAAGLRVIASHTGGLSLPDEPSANRVVARTDANGRFKLEGLAKGLYYVSANGRGRGAASRASVRVGTRVDLVIFPSGSVYGTVLGADGRAVPGATVATAARPWGFGGTEGVDDRGSFEINGLVPGTYDVIARAPGLAPAVAAEVTIDRRTEARVDLVLRPGARVVGRLVDGNERPLPGKVAVGDLGGQPVPRVLADALRSEAGADGRFAIEGVPAGAHALGANAPGQAAQRVEIDVREGERQVDVGDVRMEVGIAIRGRVRSKSGQPIADAAVRAVRGTMMQMGNEGGEARSEVDGSFVLAGLEQATYRVSAEAAGFGVESKTAEPGGEPVDLMLSTAGTLTGRVVDERGQPIDSFRVSARSSESPGPGMRMPRSEETTSEDGRFSLANVAPGGYVVTVTAPERAATTLPALKVAEGQSLDVGTVTLRAGGIVRGAVVDATGAGVPGAGVTVVPAQNMMVMFSGMAPEATTDESGAFELKGLEEGSADVTASHPNYASAEPATVKVDPAKPVTDVRLVLPLGGRIEGSVRRRDGSGRSGLMVNANATALRRPLPTASSSATTQPDGSFVLEHVPAGRVNVLVFARMGIGAMRTVDVREGETTTVEIVEREILLSGRVTRSGAPGSGLRLDAWGSGGFVSFGGMQQGAPAAAPTGPQRMTALTREDGSFEMLVEEPGTIHLNVASTDGKVRLPFRTVEVPDADAHTVDIAYNGVAVSGVVVDKETEAPIPYAAVSAGPRPDTGRDGTGGLTGQDGRFQLELEPGDYRIAASQRDGGYGSAELDVTVGSGGLADVRLALPKGVAIAGKVTDATGRPAGGVSLRAVPPESGGGGGWAQSLPDGSFEIGGLKEGTYALAGDGGNGSFVVRPGVAAGARNLTLALQPGARVTVTVKGPDGTPLKDAYPTVSRVNGVRVGYLGRPAGPTDAQGRTELLVPSGDLQVWVRKDPLGGGATVSVGPGESASVSVVVKEGSLSPP